MANALLQFDKRLKRIERTNRRLSRGFVLKVGNDGLVSRKARKGGIRLPARGLVFLFVGFFGFKGFLLAHLGPETYGSRVEILGNGTLVEKAGAIIMQADRLTEGFARVLSPIAAMF